MLYSLVSISLGSAEELFPKNCDQGHSGITEVLLNRFQESYQFWQKCVGADRKFFAGGYTTLCDFKEKVFVSMISTVVSLSL